MTSLTCKIVDGQEQPIQGVLAMMTCKDDHDRPMARYISMSTANGLLDSWQETDEECQLLGQLTRLPSSASLFLTFRLPMAFNCRQASVDLDVAGVMGHMHLTLSILPSGYWVHCDDQDPSALYFTSGTSSPDTDMDPESPSSEIDIGHVSLSRSELHPYSEDMDSNRADESQYRSWPHSNPARQSRKRKRADSLPLPQKHARLHESADGFTK